jgi:CheY-like chemotaxis protein
VLVVDDEEAVRAVLVRSLASDGFEVRQAEDGLSALTALEASSAVDLVVTDLVMPGLDGHELGRRIAARWPALRVLFVSGYSQEYLSAHQLLDLRLPLLRKPFLPSRLREAVLDALDGPPHGELLTRGGH